MARYRTVKPEFWSSAQVMECSRDARLLFIGIWNFADDHGRLPTSERSLKAQILPGDMISVEDIRRWIDELSTTGLIDVYDVDNKEYLQVTGWHHQKIDKPQKAKYPERPPTSSPRARRLIVDHSETKSPSGSTNDHRTFAPEREREREEEKEKGRREESKLQRAREIPLATRADQMLPVLPDLRPTRAPLDDPEDEAWMQFRTDITAAYEACEKVGPDTTHVAVWRHNGYPIQLCRGLVLGRKTMPRGLAWFDGKIADAIAARPTVIAGQLTGASAAAIDWARFVSLYHDKKLDWPTSLGPSPESTSCRAPREILERHGYHRQLAPPPNGPDWRGLVEAFRASEGEDWPHIMGPNPAEPFCRVPEAVLKEFGYPQIIVVDGRPVPKPEEATP